MPSMDRVLIPSFFLSQDIKKVVSYTVDDVINFKIHFGSPSKARRKRRKDKHTKLEYLENGKSFLDEIRNIFHSL